MSVSIKTKKCGLPFQLRYTLFLVLRSLKNLQPTPSTALQQGRTVSHRRFMHKLSFYTVLIFFTQNYNHLHLTMRLHVLEQTTPHPFAFMAWYLMKKIDNMMVAIPLRLQYQQITKYSNTAIHLL